jgi:predicted ATPase
MLTRLKVNGFKNLVDVDIRFGPFTCIAGANAAGKSNLFDAIRFLSALAEKPLVEAALSVRGGGRSADIRSLFHRVGDTYVDEMSFEAEMIIPSEGTDDLGQPRNAKQTFLSYELKLAYRGRDRIYPSAPLRIIHEELTSISTRVAPEDLMFPYGMEWFKTAVLDNDQRSEAFFAISGETAGRLKRVRIGDGSSSGGDAGRTAIFVDAPLTRTLLSSPNEAENATVTLARQEMRSWHIFNLEPAAMRKPDDFTASTQIDSDGAHVAAALYAAAHTPASNDRDLQPAEAAVYAGVANRLYDLIGDVRDVTVERDDKREELSLLVTQSDGTRHAARALSDGTLRFLALAVLEQQQQPGLYCIEEPENGVHPGRIPALLDLLQAIAMDTSYPIEPGNPLRQVIISTHSPSIVSRVPADSLVVAELWPSHDERGRYKRARFRGLAGTWRDPQPGRDSLALGTLLAYLNPEGYRPLPETDPERASDAEPTIIDRADVRDLFRPLPALDG